MWADLFRLSLPGWWNRDLVEDDDTPYNQDADKRACDIYNQQVRFNLVLYINIFLCE